MNIKAQGLNLFNGYGLKSTQDRMERQQKRDDQIAFFEQQKENLKNMKADTLEEISRKLDLLHNYNDQIEAAKAEYNNSQMHHVLDEAEELGEKIAKTAEKFEPKTAEERREDMIEEATGVEKDEGMLDEMMDELTEFTEEMAEESLEEMEEVTDEMVSEAEIEQKLFPVEGELQEMMEQGELSLRYKRVDYRV